MLKRIFKIKVFGAFFVSLVLLFANTGLVEAGSCRVVVSPGTAGYQNTFTVTSSDFEAGKDYSVWLDKRFNVWSPGEWGAVNVHLDDYKADASKKLVFVRSPGGDDTKPGNSVLIIKRKDGGAHICTQSYTIGDASRSCEPKIQPRQPGLSDSVVIDFPNPPSAITRMWVDTAAPTGAGKPVVKGQNPGSTRPGDSGVIKTSDGYRVEVGNFKGTGTHTVTLEGTISGQGHQTLCRANFKVGATTGDTGSGEADSAETFEGSRPIDCSSGGIKGIQTAIGCIPISESNAFVGWFLRWALGISGGVAFVLMLMAGFQIMTAAGKPEQVQGGKELLNAAISGLVLIIFSVFLLKLIGVDILGLPGFGGP